jgi:hypothetical protein
MNYNLNLNLILIAIPLMAVTTSHMIISAPVQAKPQRSLELLQRQGGFNVPSQTFGNSIPRETIQRPGPSFTPPAPFKLQPPPGNRLETIQRGKQFQILQQRPASNILPTQPFKPPVQPENFIQPTPGLNKPNLQQLYPITGTPLPTELKPINKPGKPKPPRPITVNPIPPWLKPPHKPHKPKPPHKPPHHHRPWVYHYHHYYWNSFWTYPNWYDWQPGGIWYPLREQVVEVPDCEDFADSEKIEIGTVLQTLPKNSQSFDVGGSKYYNSCGAYLLASGSGYRVVAPPIGASVTPLPEGAITVYDSNNKPYFYHNGTFYSQSTDGYTIILPPSGLEVPYLPKGYTTVPIHGSTYYLYGGITYQMSNKNGKTVYVVSN